MRAGYLAAGATIDGSEAAERRMTLCHLYMQTLLLTEMGPRGYTDPQYLEFFGGSARSGSVTRSAGCVDPGQEPILGSRVSARCSCSRSWPESRLRLLSRSIRSRR